MYLDSESQPPYDSFYENESLYRDGGSYDDVVCI